MTDKDRSTITFDKDVFDGILAQRARPEDARKSISRIVNDLLKEALIKRKEEKTA